MCFLYFTDCPQNDWKWQTMTGNCSKCLKKAIQWLKLAGNGWTELEMAKNGCMLMEMAGTSWTLMEMTENKDYQCSMCKVLYQLHWPKNARNVLSPGDFIPELACAAMQEPTRSQLMHSEQWVTR